MGKRQKKSNNQRLSDREVYRISGNGRKVVWGGVIRMKRTYSTGFKDYKFSKLYLDEINDILNFIKENNYSYKIKINK